MTPIPTRSGYLVAAVLAFVLAAYGFAGLLELRGGRTHPAGGGAVCLAMGAYFFYRWVTYR